MSVAGESGLTNGRDVGGGGRERWKTRRLTEHVSLLSARRCYVGGGERLLEGFALLRCAVICLAVLIHCCVSAPSLPPRASYFESSGKSSHFTNSPAILTPANSNRDSSTYPSQHLSSLLDSTEILLDSSLTLSPHHHPHIPSPHPPNMTEYMDTDAAAEQQGDSKKISFRFCREW